MEDEFFEDMSEEEMRRFWALAYLRLMDELEEYIDITNYREANKVINRLLE